MEKKTYFEAQKWAREQLSGSDIDPFAPQFLLKTYKNWDDTHLLLHNQEQMSEEEWTWFERATARLLNHEPAQYIVGSAPFYGRMFAVSHDVLIPEAETEELVEWVLENMTANRSLKVLDLGTGSGVIGITLALERPQWEVTLSDVSSEALQVARKNLNAFNLDLRTVESDLFQGFTGEKFDLIVTNPPYISRADVGLMDQSVLKYEPEIALFADENGLGIYHRIFTEAHDYLTTDGAIYGETGFNQEKTIQELLHQINASAKIETKHDITNKMRMVHAWNFSSIGGN